MPRPTGSANKKESKRQLRERIAQLEEALKAGGSGSLDKPVVASAPEVTEEDADPNETGNSSVGGSQSLVITPPEPDTYSCGNCKGKMAEPLTTCPHCGANLRW